MQDGDDMEMNDILDKNARDDDDEDELADTAEATLLGHQLPQPPSAPKGLWSQIQGIVIEVHSTYKPSPISLTQS